MVRPKLIEWESISGLKNSGSVVFTPLLLGGGGSLSSTAAEESSTSSSTTSSTLMTLCFRFVAPRVVSGLFRRSGRLRKYTEDELLGSMLSDFRDVVLAEVGGRGGISTIESCR